MKPRAPGRCQPAVTRLFAATLRIDGRSPHNARVPITLESRHIGDIHVVSCAGRLVEGPELIALRQSLDELMADGGDMVLHVAGVDFIDSSGLGLLVRYVTRARNAHSNIKLCAASSNFAEVLKVTNLRP